MFDKLKKAKKRVSENVKKARAKSRGLSVAEYDRETEYLKKQKQDEELKYREWKIKENYRKKKKNYRRRGGGNLLDSISGMGKNVLNNVDGSPSSFNRALMGEQPRKKRKRKKKPRKVVVYEY